MRYAGEGDRPDEIQTASVDPNVVSLMRAVAEFYPVAGKRMTPKKAAAILEHSFRGIPVQTIAEYLSRFSGARPEDTAPPWDAIRARMISDRVLFLPGHTNDAKRAAEATEEAEWRKRNDQRIADLHAVPEDKWADVCNLGADMFPMSDHRKKPVPANWEQLPYWVLSLWGAWQIIQGKREIPRWVTTSVVVVVNAEGGLP